QCLALHLFSLLASGPGLATGSGGCPKVLTLSQHRRLAAPKTIRGACQTVDLRGAVKSRILHADDRELTRREASESFGNIEHSQHVQKRRSVTLTIRPRTMRSGRVHGNHGLYGGLIQRRIAG